MTTRSPKKSQPATKKKSPAPEAPQKRVRLTTDVRRQQILDAALIEFGALGFTAASISKIAARAGTSKANLYVHFANKDEIFETLLRDRLAPASNVWKAAQPDQTIGQQIDVFIDTLYGDLEPTTISLIRLLIAESHRVPALIQRWHEEVLAPARAKQQQDIDRYVAAGTLRASPLTDHFAFVTAPLLYVAVVKMVFREDVANSEFEKIKDTHRKMLHFLLAPQADEELRRDNAQQGKSSRTGRQPTRSAR